MRLAVDDNSSALQYEFGGLKYGVLARKVVHAATRFEDSLRDATSWPSRNLEQDVLEAEAKTRCLAGVVPEDASGVKLASNS